MDPDTVDNAAKQQSFITQVYGWMTAGLAVSGGVAVYVASNESLAQAILGNQLVFFGLLVFELVLVLVLASLVSKFSAKIDVGLFLLYALVSGLTLSVIFFIYSISSIVMTFFVTAGTFGAMCLYGYFTKKDLTRLGSLLIMALFGLILAQIVNLFIRTTTFNLVVASAGVLIFVGLTAYDTQKIKNFIPAEGEDNPDMEEKDAISGALTLYLDFINLFLNLLRLLGRRR